MPASRPRTFSARSFALVSIIAVTWIAASCATPTLRMPEPEIVYEGTGPQLSPGVLVIRGERDLETGLEPLDPDFAGELPSMRTRSLLRIVGQERENSCRETALLQVSTHNQSALVVLEERFPPDDCMCAQVMRPPAAWLVEVSHLVRRAEVDVRRGASTCGSSARAGGSDDPAPVLLWESTWDREPGASVITNPQEYAALAQAARRGVGAAPDFSRFRVVAVTGRPRSNGCRKTRLVESSVSGSEAVFVLEEFYPGPGQMCTQVYSAPRLYAYRVPGSVDQARIITREVR